MQTSIISTRIDAQTKLAFTQICDEVGLSPSQALKLFAKAVVNHRGIPFEVKARELNQDTINAIHELEMGQGYQAKNFTDLLQDMELDNETVSAISQGIAK